MMQEDGPDSVIDAGIIAAAQRVEHYEIAGYGVVRTFASILGEDEAEGLLQETLDEEGAADETLTEIAEGIVNEEAEEADEEETATSGRRSRSR
jgi:ferritin-like metal-binding protein YciE